MQAQPHLTKLRMKFTMSSGPVDLFSPFLEVGCIQDKHSSKHIQQARRYESRNTGTESLQMEGK